MNFFENRDATRRAAVLLFALLLLLPGSSFGQSTLKSLLEQAVSNYPGIAAKMAKAEALKAKASMERNSALPSLDASWQVNYATFNNITGMTASGTLFPISGPPSADNDYEGVPGTAAALTLKWSPVTFGQRSASIDYAEKMYERQISEVTDEVLRIQSKVALTYLNLVTLEQLTAVHRKNLERSLSNLDKIRALAEAGIRPSVDSLQFVGEVSKARTGLLKMENQFESAKLELQELLASSNPVEAQTDNLFFNRLPLLPNGGAEGTGATPQLVMAKQELEANKSLLKQISRSWTPRLDLFGTTFARGSGIGFDGTVDKSSGWSFNRYNYGIGMQVVFPVFDISNVRLKSRQQEAIVKNYEHLLEQTGHALNRQEQTALNELSTSLKIAGEIPVEFQYSEMAYKALQSRYQAGLTDYSELIRAQYDLLNAEASLRIAYVNAWKSLLMLSVIRGDINAFLQQTEQ